MAHDLVGRKGFLHLVRHVPDDPLLEAYAPRSSGRAAYESCATGTCMAFVLSECTIAVLRATAPERQHRSDKRHEAQASNVTNPRADLPGVNEVPIRLERSSGRWSGITRPIRS